MDNLTKEQRKKNMQAIKSSGTNIENILAKALWQKGYRYRRNCKNIIGKPDIVLRKYKLVIFCDSEFWHGKNWTKNKFKIHSNTHFWHRKIESNIKRDKFINKKLKKQGWSILRFWGVDIKKDLNNCLIKIEENIANFRKQEIK